eukprot:jgi/Mesen1/6708/ME000344S05988
MTSHRNDHPLSATGSHDGPSHGRDGSRKPEEPTNASTHRLAAVGSRSKPLRGRQMLMNIQVKQTETFLMQMFHLYVLMLRVPVPIFCLCLLSGPLLLSLCFTQLYMLDTDGLYIPPDSEWARGGALCEAVESWVGILRVRVFLFSFSLSTTFGGARVEARSPYALLVANVNTLCAQLLFVFLSGAVFQRLSQPSSPVLWSSMALICDDTLAESFSPASGKNSGGQKVLLTRLLMAGKNPSVLIDAKFDLVLRRFVNVPGQNTAFVQNIHLPLVRAEVSYLRYGMLLRHIIDEDSPLYGSCDFDTLWDEDASFSVSVLALERSSMQPVFGTHLYSVTDGDVVWNREFEDTVTMNFKTKRFMVDHRKLNKLKPLNPTSQQFSARNKNGG